MRNIPAIYLGADVPPAIHAAWFRWEGASWRTAQYLGTNKPFPPDQRFTVRFPKGICEAHGELWLGYRNMYFDPYTGNRWPGASGSPFEYHGHDMDRLREERRVEWDEKASAQMQLIERICLRGDSPQCSADVPLRRPVVDLYLPELAA